LQWQLLPHSTGTHPGQASLISLGSSAATWFISFGCLLLLLQLLLQSLLLLLMWLLPQCPFGGLPVDDSNHKAQHQERTWVSGSPLPPAKLIG